MIFFLSLGDELPSFLTWARSQLARADEAFRGRFEPAMRGLELAAAGTASSDAAFAARGGRVFTGWSTTRHWLTPADASA
jgi:hypothetical protein